jgi:Baseplate J-like protein
MGARNLAERQSEHELRPPVDGADVTGADPNPPDTIRHTTTTPRVLFIDVDDDLAILLDRVEDAGNPAIIVLPEGARAVHGVVSARLLARRAKAAGIPLVAVATGRTAITQLTAVGIPCVSTVGEARTVLSTLHSRSGGHAAALPAAIAHSLVAAPVPIAPLPLPVVDEDDDEDEPLDQGSDDNSAVVAPNDLSQIACDDDRASAASVVSVAGGANASRRGVDSHPRRRWPIAVAICMLLAMLGLAAWVVLFPKATVAIHYRDQAFNQVFDVPLGAVSGEGIPIHTTHLLMSDSRVVAGTGTMLVPDKHATGTVTFANQLDGVVIVPAGTNLLTESGVRFATTAEARVPGAVHSFSGTSNGQASIGVEAVAAGDASNVVPGSIVGLEGRLKGALLVTNYSALTGGTMRTVYSLIPSDLTAPLTPLKLSIAAREKALLASRYGKSPLRQFQAPIFVSSSVQRFEQAGRPFARVLVAMRTNMTYIHAEDVQAFAIAKRTSALADKNQRIVAGTSLVVVRTIGSGPHARLQVQVTARTAPSIDVANLRALLTGRSVADARQLLDGSARNGNWHYVLKLSPDWASRLPIASGLISIAVIREG